MKSLPPLQLFLLSLLTVLFGSAVVWYLLGCPATGIDDADIFFVYARNFAEGHGFVYNIGSERVEGFTSLLWTLICTCLFRLTDHVEILLYLINLLISTATLWVCLRRVQKPVVFIVLLAAVPAWFAWCQTSLMETGLWCCLLTLAVLAVVDRRTALFSLLLPLLLITRPESMLWGAWLILIMGLSAARTEGLKKGVKITFVPATVFVAALVSLIALRIGYFNYPLPNTFYAKVSPGFSSNLWNGTGYLLQYLFSNPAIFLVVVTWCWILARGLRNGRADLDQNTIIALCLLPGIGIPVLVGGDHFGGFRFCQPIWPLLCLLAATHWIVVLDRLRPGKVRIGLIVLLLCGWILFPFTARMKHEFRIALESRETGAALAAMFGDLDEYPTVATITAGGIKFAYPGTVLDLMGLNATEMAHAPGSRAGYKNHTAFNRDIFYAWYPDILLCGEDAAFDAKVLKGLPFDDRFRQLYVKVELQRTGRAVNAYYSHRFLEKIHSERPGIGLRQ